MMAPLALIGAVLAQDPEPDGEMVVVGDREQRAWAALDATMADLGYHRRTRASGTVVYRPPGQKRWKPKVVVTPDGRYRFRSPQVVFQGVYTDAAPGQEIAGTPALSSLGVGTRLWITSRRKLQGHEHRIADAIHPDIRDINDAIAARAHSERLLATLSDLEGRWEAPGDPAHKRAEIARLWLSRSESPEGREMQSLLSDFITEVVQRSGSPFSPAEIAAIREECGCGFPLLPAVVENVGAEAMARLAQRGPHLATYTKVGTGEKALEIRYQSPQSVSLTVYGSEERYAVSVDRAHLRFSFRGACAVVPIEATLGAIERIPVDGGPGEGFSAQLDYRITPGGDADVAFAFARGTQAVPLLWLLDMDDEETVLREEGKEWVASLRQTEWAVSKKTGVLSWMRAGENALALSRLARVPEGPLPPICEAPTSAFMSAQFSTRFLIPAYQQLIADVAAAWPALGEGQRRRVHEQHVHFWEAYFDAEFPFWVEQLAGGPWEAHVVSGMADRERYEAFVASLPPQEQDRALEHWAQRWYAGTGDALLTEHLQELHDDIAGALVADAETITAVVSVPMGEGAVRSAETTLGPVLYEAVERGKAALLAGALGIRKEKTRP